MRVFLDTEFTSLAENSKLVSIGLVSAWGADFYAEVAGGYSESECSQFVRGFVLPLLEGGAVRSPLLQIAHAVVNWLEGLDEPVIIAVDSPLYDWRWLQALCVRAGRWPSNVARDPLPLSINYIQQYDAYAEAREAAFATLRRHHALDDARANLIAWRAGGGDVLQE